MCGLSALISPTGDSRLVSNIVKMTHTVRHRGPDDEGYVFFSDGRDKLQILGGEDTLDACFQSDYRYCPQSIVRPSFSESEPVVAFGHRRLSIIDLSAAGHQPMCSEDQRYWIIYNGEIYNFIELREELKNRGHDFCSLSDTEVIIQSYKEWGESCLNRLNGMFAFVIFDRELDTLFLARDRFGIKPLYWWISNEGIIAIASEIKQFTVLPGWTSRLNAQRAYDYLNWGLSDHTSETLFSDVKQLQGGEYATISLKKLPNKIHSRNWYKLNQQYQDTTRYSAVKTFKELLTDSVRLRLRSDVQVGSCLSGGLDSSTIVCIINNLLKNEGLESLQTTFSARAYDKQFDEGEYIDTVVRKTNAHDHHVYPELSDLFSSLDTIVWHQDEPFNTSSIFAQWMVFKLASANGIKVMLDGQGADELLAGYDVYAAARLAGLLKRLEISTLYREIRQTSRNKGWQLELLTKRLFNHLLPEIIRQPLRKKSGKASTFPIWLNLKRLNVDATDPFIQGGHNGATVNGLSIAQLGRTHLPMLLHWEDRDSMAHSVESRVPFLDYRLVNFLINLPEENKISDGISKKILRESMNGLLPENIRMRMDKIGFITPEERWVRKDAPDIFRHQISRAIESSKGLITPLAADKLENIIAGREPYDNAIWRIISFGRWMELFKLAPY